MRFFTLCLVSICIMIPCALFAEQPYKASFGGRAEQNKGDFYIGPDYRLFLNQSSAINLFALTDCSHGIEFYGLYQLQGKFPEVPRKFYWFVGGGAHVGTWQGFDDRMVVGADGIAGVEYCFDSIPLSLAADWHPLFNIITEKKRDRFWPLKFGITARYLIR